MNKFEQVSSLGHQMSLPVGWGTVHEGLYSEAQCILGNSHVARMTDKTVPSHNFVGGWKKEKATL